ncbi:Ribosome maturation factor RimM [Frankliniella fusca]|uniref:Ribosome maturation factor RimM n=1 Tax=Frankliniella fusca TaxID=407009 RepID=A0AAE1I1W9_9NEOP|nr:Ribosome maturation factor RimM [Frankliniella fusca]
MHAQPQGAPAAAAAGPGPALGGLAAPFQPPVPRVVSASEMLTLRRAVPKFDGKISYEAYRASFDDLVGLYPFLTDDQRFQLLSSGLVGAPQSLLEDLTANRTFAALDQALRLSYSKPVHAWTEMQNLTTMKQDASETLEEWSTRVSRAAHRAYPDTPLPRVEEYAVQYFFIGLHSAAIRNGVAGLTCNTLQEALGACRLVRSRLPPQSGPAAKRVCLASVSEAAVEVAPVVPAPAAPAAAPSAPAAPGPSWQDQLSALTRQVEQVVRQTKVATDAGTDTSANGGRGRGRGPPYHYPVPDSRTYVQPQYYHANLTWPAQATPLQLAPLPAPAAAPQVQTAVLALPAGYPQVALPALPAPRQPPGNGQ